MRFDVNALSLSLSLALALSLSSLSLSIATEWQPLGKGERLACFDVNAHSVKRTEPETEPETVGNFHHGAAQSLRRPTIFVEGVHRA